MRNLKKILSVLLVVAIMAISMVPAFAATSYTYEAQAKALYDAGLFKGISATEYVPDLGSALTREQGFALVVRLLGKADAAAALTAADVDAALAAFGDAKDIEPTLKNAVAYAVKNNLVQGDGKLVNPKGAMLGKDLATVILRNLGYTVDATGYDTATATLSDKGGLTAAEATKFATKELIRDDLVGVVYGSLQAKYSATGSTVLAKLVADKAVTADGAAKLGYVAPTTATTATATITGAKKVTLAFDGTVDATKATVTVKKGSIAVNVASVAAGTDNKSLVVTMASKFTEGDYTVSTAGIVADKTIDAKVTAADEKVAKIEFVGDKASYTRGSSYTSLDAAYKISNQYNEDVTSTYYSSVSLTATGCTPTTANKYGVFTLPLTSGTWTLGNVVSVSALYTTNTYSTFANATLTVAAQAQVASVEMSSLYNEDGKELSASTIDDYNFYIVVSAKDQYGKAITADATGASNLFSDVIINSTNPSVVVSPDTTKATDSSLVTTKTINGSDKLVIKLTAPASPIGGTATINVISKVTGSLTSFPVTVKEAAKVDTFTMSAPASAPAGKKVTIPYTAVDQFGNAITDYKILSDITTNKTGVSVSATSGTIAWENNAVTGKAELKLTCPATKGTVAITASTQYTTSSPTKVSNLTINVTDSAVPTVVAGYTSDVKTNLLKDGGYQDIKNTYITLQDQYGSSYDMNTVAGSYNDTKDSKTYNYYFAVSTSDASIISIDNTGKQAINSTVSRLTANKKGTATITTKLYKSTDGVNFTEVADSANATTFTVVEKADIQSYAVATVATLYENPSRYSTNSHGTDLAVTGTLANGKTVTIPVADAAGNVNYTTVVASTYVSVATGNQTTATKVYSAGTGFAWTTNQTERPVKFVVSVNGANGTEILTIDTKVGNSDVAPTTLSLRTNSDKALHEDNTLANSTYRMGKYEDASTVSVAAAKIDITSLANFNASVTKLVNTNVKVVDQYGKTMPSAVYTADTANVDPYAAGEFGFTNVFVTAIKDGTGTATHVVSGTTVNYTFADVTTNFTFNVTAITSNGVQISFKVVVK